MYLYIVFKNSHPSIIPCPPSSSTSPPHPGAAENHDSSVDVVRKLAASRATSSRIPKRHPTCQPFEGGLLATPVRSPGVFRSEGEKGDVASNGVIRKAENMNHIGPGGRIDLGEPRKGSIATPSFGVLGQSTEGHDDTDLPSHGSGNSTLHASMGKATTAGTRLLQVETSGFQD